MPATLRHVKATGVRVDSDAIVAAATRLFAAKGFRGTTMRDLSAELGLHAGSLYVHIRDKGDLLERIVMRISDIHERDMQEVLVADQSAEEMLREVCRRHVGMFAKDREAYRVYFHEWRNLDAERQAHIVGVRDAYEQALREILDRAAAEGTYDPSLDRDVAARALLGMLNWTYEWFRDDGPLDSDQVADTFVDIFLTGITPTH